MSDEIKEILDDLRDEDCYWLDCGRKNTSLSYDEAHLLLDYITNLQQKVEQLENIRKEAIEYTENRIVDDDYMLKTDTEMVQKELLNILNKGSDKA